MVYSLWAILESEVGEQKFTSFKKPNKKPLFMSRLNYRLVTFNQLRCDFKHNLNKRAYMVITRKLLS